MNIKTLKRIVRIVLTIIVSASFALSGIAVPTKEVKAAYTTALIYQNGTSGYASAQLNMLDQDNPTTVFKDDGSVYVGQFDLSYSTLYENVKADIIRFPNLNIAGEQLVNAKLHIKESDYSGTPGIYTVRAHKVSRTNWHNDYATFNRYASGLDWTVPGGDFGAVIASGGDPGVGNWLTLDLGTNFTVAELEENGIFLDMRGGNFDGLYFYSINAATVADRPYLELTFADTPPQGRFAEPFSSTIFKDTTKTSAIWSGSGQASAATYPLTNIGTTIQAAGITGAVKATAVDQANRLLYIGDASGHFARYNIATGVATNLTTYISGFWGAAPINAMAVDQGKVYMISTSSEFGVYDPAIPSGTDLMDPALAEPPLSLAVDTTEHVLYIGGYGGQLSTYDATNGVETISSSSGLSAFWGTSTYTDVIYSLTYDPGGKMYLSGVTRDFAYIDTSTGSAVNLSSTAGMSTVWTGTGTAANINSITYSAADGKVYMAGDDTNGPEFSVYAPGSPSSIVSLLSAPGLDGMVGNGYLISVTHSTDGGIIYIGGNGGWVYYYDTSAGEGGSIGNEGGYIDFAYSDSRIFVHNDAVHDMQYFFVPCISCATSLSLEDDVSDNITTATLTKNDTPGTGSVAYELSNDGGVTWEDVTAGVAHAFSSSGSDLRFRVTVMGDATVQDLDIVYYHYSSAASPIIFNYQARVTDEADAAINAATNMRFAIYDAASSGNCLWSGWGSGVSGCDDPNASHVAITPVDGVFTVPLGDTTFNSQMEMSNEVFADDTRYLEVQMYNGATWETLSPRKRITSTSYAMNAKRLLGLASSASGPVLAHIVATDSSGKLTIGGGTEVSGGAITLTASGASVWSTSSGALTITSAVAASWGTAAGNLSFYAAGSGTGSVVIGSGSASATPDLLVLDVKNDAGDPTGSVGTMYYNSNAGKFRCYQGAAWGNCDGSGIGAPLQTAYGIGATIVTANSTDIAFDLASGDFNVSGTGAINLTPTAASQFTSGGALTFTAGAASTWSTTADLLTITGGDGVTLDSTTTGSVNIGIGGSGKTITIGNGTGATALAFTSGTAAQSFTSAVTTGNAAASAFVFNASAITSGTAMYLTSTATTGKLLDMNLTNTTGTIWNAGYEVGVTQTGPLLGFNFDLNTNLTAPTAGRSLTVVNTQTPVETTTSNDIIVGGYRISGGDVQNSAAGSIDWRGMGMIGPNVTQGASGSANHNGMRAGNGTITTDGTANVLHVNAQGVGAGILNGIKISEISADAGAERGISIGTGWERGIYFPGGGKFDTANDIPLSFKTGTTGAITIDSTTSGAVNVGTGGNAKMVTIGTVTASATLSLRAADGGITLEGKGDAASGTYFVCYNTGTNRLYNGASGATCATSSLRYKDNIQDLSLGLDAVRALRPVSFTYNDTGIEALGFIAEEVAQIDTRPITYLDNRVNAIDWSQVTPIVAQGLKELDAQVQGISAAVGSSADGAAMAVSGRLKLGHGGLALSSRAAEAFPARLSFEDPAGNEIAYLAANGDLTVSGRLYLGAPSGLSFPSFLTVDTAGRVMADLGFSTEKEGYAQAYSSDATILPGTIVAGSVADARRIASATMYDVPIGVIVKHVGFLSGIGNAEVVVTGTAEVRVMGAIAIGDAIAANDNGVGAKFASSGWIIGYAISSHAGDGEGIVTVLIAPEWRESDAEKAGLATESSASNEAASPQLTLPGAADYDALAYGFVNAITVQGYSGSWRIDENGIFAAVASKGVLQSDAEGDVGPDLTVYAQMGDEARLEFGGTGSIIGGRGRIIFASEASSFIGQETEYAVYVTPTSDGGMIHVSDKGREGFDVRSEVETNMTFDWVVIVRRANSLSMSRDSALVGE